MAEKSKKLGKSPEIPLGNI